jgi:hypothetical protein
VIAEPYRRTIFCLVRTGVLFVVLVAFVVSTWLW